MKKYFIAILFVIAVASPVSAQHYIGARAGWGVGFGRFTPISWYTMKPVWGLYSGGLQWKYYGKVRYIGAIGAEVEFLQRAYQLQNGIDSEDYTRRIYNSINVPLIWHIHYNFHHNSLRVFLNAGVWASYNLSATQWIKVGDYIAKSPYKLRLVRDNPLGYGLLGGLGMNVIMGRWELMFEARYYFSYGDILRNNAVYAGNPVRSPLDNVSVSLGFFYRFGKKPHIPLPPSAWGLSDREILEMYSSGAAEAESVATSEDATDSQTETQSATDEELVQSEIQVEPEVQPGNPETPDIEVEWNEAVPDVVLTESPEDMVPESLSSEDSE